MTNQVGARRFDMGERANFALMPALVATLEQLLLWGVKNIEETLTMMTREIAERTAELGLYALPEAHRADHFLGLRRAEGLPRDLTEKLRAEKIHVSVRGSSMRITPHLYNNAADVEKLIAALKKYLGR